MQFSRARRAARCSSSNFAASTFSQSTACCCSLAALRVFSLPRATFLSSPGKRLLSRGTKCVFFATRDICFFSWEEAGFSGRGESTNSWALHKPVYVRRHSKRMRQVQCFFDIPAEKSKTKGSLFLTLSAKAAKEFHFPIEDSELGDNWKKICCIAFRFDHSPFWTGSYPVL